MSHMDVSLSKNPYKKTDYRHEIWIKERKALKKKTEKKSFKVELGNQTSNKKGVITVDTSKARSNLDVLRMCLKTLGWREYPFGKKDGGICDITWHSVQFTDGKDEVPGGRINKFPGIVEILRKVNLGRALDVMHKLFPEHYDFHPQQWFLPQQFAEFSDACRRMNEKAKTNRPVFIVKPDEGSQGDGIYLIHDPKQYYFSSSKNHVVQEYIADPFILENLKFDFRVYVVIASLNPLEIYISKEGLARFCTIAYEHPTNKNIRESYMHLTNYSLNKYSNTYQHTESEDDGSKRTMSSVFKKMSDMGYNVERTWNDIKKMVTKTCIAIAGELKVEHHAALPPHKVGPSCFQILGFDVLLSDTCKPYLLEVNASPSLRIDYDREVAPGIVEHVLSPVDEEIKKPLVLDTLLLMAPKGKKSTRYIRKLDKDFSNLNARMTNRSRASISREPTGADMSESDSEDDLEHQTPAKKTQGYGVLEQIYPGHIGDLYDEIRIMERLADVFLECLGVRGHLHMGSTGFRNFTRRCKIAGPGSGFTNAALDIMYIDCCRRWEHMNVDTVTGGGLCYQGFVEAFVQLADKKFPSNNNFDSFLALLEHCELYLGEVIKEKRPSARISGRGTMFPSISRSETSQDDRLGVYKSSTMRKKMSANGNNSYFLDYRNFSADAAKNSTKSGSTSSLSSSKKKLSRSKTNISHAGVRLRKLGPDSSARDPSRKGGGGGRENPE